MSDDERAKLRAAFDAFRTLEAHDEQQQRIANDVRDRMLHARSELRERMESGGITAFVMGGCLVRLARMSPAEQPRVVVQPVEVLS